MTTFLRLLSEPDKAAGLAESCARVRQEASEPRCFEVAPDAFDAVPGKPFAYWVSEAVRETFREYPAFQACGRTAASGGKTLDDFRFIRATWEIPEYSWQEWRGFAKGGTFSPFYADVHLYVSWNDDARALKAYLVDYRESRGWSPNWTAELHSNELYFRPGLTWPRRTQGGLSLRAMPAGCIFADKGPAAFVADDDPEDLLALLALTNSRAFALLVSLQMAFGSYEVGVIQKTPIPPLTTGQRPLTTLARRAWSLKRTLDTTTETSHAFLLPAALRPRLGDFDPPAIEAELARIQSEIDAIAFDLYGFTETDRRALSPTPFPEGEGLTLPSPASGRGAGGEGEEDDEIEDNATDDCPLTTDHLLSWSVGVAFGRFDWRLATGEREPPPEPDPFDPLPAKSPGMLPEGLDPFHVHAGLLVDDPGHPHDLARLVERVLERMEMPVPADLRRWLQRDVFPFHLQRYSKSRRKAPIYWPLSTASGSYTLWLYYPSLTSQTLYTALIDFVEPKLTEVSAEAGHLRAKGPARSRDEEKRLEALQALESELRDLRDQLQSIAPRYQPNQDDGVQITAAPLWPLFRHKPWQTLLKETWTKLEQGDYDWSHLAMAYWPERVREKCKTDKSLAIAHDLEALYVEPEAKPTKKSKRSG